jgi:1-acyl-sn-glycerol-3-phosphate acyltransferase
LSVYYGSNKNPFYKKFMFPTLRLCLSLLVHVWRGQRTITRQFSGWQAEQRMEAIRLWSRGLLAIVGVELRVKVLPHAEAALDEQSIGQLVVCNHISWLDVFVINAWRPAMFVSKSEVGKWPVLGPLVTGAGTLYIEREKRRDALKLVKQIAQALQEGGSVAIFPEGTTSDGTGLLHFHANLLQAPVSVSAPVQPLTLRYLDAATGELTQAASYVGEMSLLQSMRALATYRSRNARKPHIVAELTVLAPQRGDDRRLLCNELRQAMSAALGVSNEH